MIDKDLPVERLEVLHSGPYYVQVRAGEVTIHIDLHWADILNIQVRGGDDTDTWNTLGQIVIDGNTVTGNPDREREAS